MADSSPSLQTGAPGFLNEISTPHDTALAASQKEASARLASELLSGSSGGLVQASRDTVSTSDGSSQSTGPLDRSLGRAMNVLAGGLADGVVESAKNSLNIKTVESVAESVGIGYGLGALVKAGPLGEKAAMIGGLAMGAAWAYSEYEKGRPQATINATIDAYNGVGDTTQERRTIAANGGALAFEAGLAGLSGGLGMKAGLGLKQDWHIDAINKGQSYYDSAANFIARDGRLNGAHVLGQGDGLAFAGKDSAAPTDMMAGVKDIISGKTRSAASLAEIQENFARSHAQRNDAHLLDMRSQLADLESQHAVVRGEESTQGSKLTRAVRDRAASESLDTLENSVRVKQEALTDAQTAQRQLPTQQAVVDRLFAEKQEAFQKQVPKPGEPVDAELAQAFHDKQALYKEEKAKLDSMRQEGSQDSIARQRQALEDARTALETARKEQPAKLAEADQQISSINDVLSGLKTRRADIESQIAPIFKEYNGRLDLLTKDPGQLVQAQFEPPQPAPVKAKKVETVPAAPEVAPPPPIKEAVVTPDAAATPKLDASTRPSGSTEATTPVEVKAAPPVEARPAGTQTLDRTTAPATGDKAAAPENTGLSRLSPASVEARDAAMTAVRGNQLLREKEYCTKVLTEIGNGTYRPTGRASISEVKTEMQRRLEVVDRDLQTEQPVRYTRALKAVLEYGRAISKDLAQTPELAKRQSITDQGLKDLETMMGNLPTSYKGYPEVLDDLPEPGRGPANSSPEMRLAQVKKHLEDKVALLDSSRDRHINAMGESQPVLKAIMDRIKDESLPDDGSLVLFDKNGKYLGPVGGKSPYFIEVSRMMDRGFGANGGGFNRFEHILDDIGGAAILRPIYENGVKVELPQRSGSTGKVVYKKTVTGSIGDVPEGVKPGLDFAKILREYAPPRDPAPVARSQG